MRQFAPYTGAAVFRQKGSHAMPVPPSPLFGNIQVAGEVLWQIRRWECVRAILKKNCAKTDGSATGWRARRERSGCIFQYSPSEQRRATARAAPDVCARIFEIRYIFQGGNGAGLRALTGVPAPADGPHVSGCLFPQFVPPSSPPVRSGSNTAAIPPPLCSTSPPPVCGPA